MFGKTSACKDLPSKSVEQTPSFSQSADSVVQDKNVRQSILSAETTLVGELKSKGDIVVQGTIDGNIECRCLTLNGNPEIKGSAHAETAVVSGTFKGDIRAKTVVLTETAKMLGDIFNESLEIHPGADFQGQVKRLQAKIAKPAGSTKSKKANGVVHQARKSSAQQDA